MMNNTWYREQEERQVSRAEKIASAKSAFSGGSARGSFHRGRRGESRPMGGFLEGSGYGSEPAAAGRGAFTGETVPEIGGGHHFGMLRMVTAVVLFFVLVLSFHFNLSYQKYDREYVEQVLSDDSHWESLVRQVEQVMKQTVPK